MLVGGREKVSRYGLNSLPFSFYTTPVFKRENKIFLEAANPAYEPIELNLNEVTFQGKLLAVWRKI